MRKRSFVMTAGLCLAALPLIASVALADPSGNPPTRILAGGGSDTTQDVLNGLSNVPADGSRIIGSYDAVGSATIQTKTGSGCVINRPVGSAGGVLALNAERVAASAPNPVRRPCLDFARSSSDLSQDSRFNGAGLTFVPFAGDQVSFVTRRDSAIPANLSNTQLRAIYECTAPGTISNPPTILPLLPQSNSGTRAFFLKALGGGTAITPGSCVSSVDPTDSTKQLIENTGNRLTDPRHIAPYSVAQFNSQYYRVVTPVQGSTELRRINSQIPGSATFPAAFQREVFNVIPTRNINDEPYKSTFVGSSSAVCTSTGVITQFGFSLLPSGRCGAIDPLLQTPGGLGPNPGPPTT